MSLFAVFKAAIRVKSTHPI